MFPAMQMRFPNRSAAGKARSVHHMTLLDGEMIVDCDVTTGKQTRRFLAYDLMTLNTRSLATRPFKARPSAMAACLHETAPTPPQYSSLDLAPCSRAQLFALMLLECVQSPYDVLCHMLSCCDGAGALCDA